MENKHNLYCIMGRTCSGKDTLLNYLKDKINGTSVCSYTNRPKRENETDGVEHHFIDKKTFDDLKKDLEEKKELVAYTKISKDDNSEGYEYMASLDSVLSSDFYIIDPNGLYYLIDNFADKFNITTINVVAPEEIRYERAKSSRSDFETEFKKRNENEDKQFKEFKNFLDNNRDKVTNIIYNSYLDQIENFNNDLSGSYSGKKFLSFFILQKNMNKLIKFINLNKNK